MHWLKSRWLKRKPTHLDFERSPMGEHIVVPLSDMPKLVQSYVDAMETGLSDDWCRCEWMVHPDDIKVKYGTCRDCGGTSNHDIHKEAEVIGFHTYKGVRRRKIDEAPDCPVHTKEGFLLYFTQWVLDHAND